MIIEIKTKKPYNVYIEKNGIGNVENYFNLDRNVLIITDTMVPVEYSRYVSKKCKKCIIITIQAGEVSKNINNFAEICNIMLNNNFTKSDCVIAVGGGVVSDLASFVSACYMRGIDFYNIPTTLLAQIDSSIGGKSGLNIGDCKNAIGTIRQPAGVLVDSNLLKTLPSTEIKNGIAEIVKIAAINDENLFNYIESHDIEKNMDEIIINTIKNKAQIIENDELESGVRACLNFGHTFGHAIERILNIKHGEAISLGMLVCSCGDAKTRIKKVLDRNNLPVSCNLNNKQILKMKEMLAHDKKMRNDYLNVVCTNQIGTFEFKKIDILEFSKKCEEEFSWVAF